MHGTGTNLVPKITHTRNKGCMVHGGGTVLEGVAVMVEGGHWWY